MGGQRERANDHTECTWGIFTGPHGKTVLSDGFSSAAPNRERQRFLYELVVTLVKTQNCQLAEQNN